MSYPRTADDGATPQVPPPSKTAHLDVDGELTPGTMIGEYKVEARLGQGGMGTVYSAMQPLIGKRAAIKVMRRELCLDPVAIDRFVQEARAVNQVGHPNIVDVFAFGNLHDGRSYMIMEWLQGETLAHRLKRGRLPVGEALAILFQICDGLAAAHDKRVVHRDLKPENLFLVPVRNRRLLVKILDFGVAKLNDSRADEPPNVNRTAKGTWVGTPNYMAPEQARGKEVDHRADIYSLGVTAYEMLLGQRPFFGEEPVDVMYQHINAAPPPPRSLRPDLPVVLDELLMSMLEKRPDRRPTLPVIDSRLAELRGSLVGRDSGPVALRALESGSQKAIVSPVAPPAAETTATSPSMEIPRHGPPRAMVAAAIVITLIAIAAAAVKLRRAPAPEAAPPPAPVVAAPAPEPPSPPQQPVVAAPAPEPPPPAPVVKKRPVKKSAPAKLPSRHGDRDYMIDPFAK
jgi:serine/threonine-protein kinase